MSGLLGFSWMARAGTMVPAAVLILLLSLTGGCAIAPNPVDVEAVVEFNALNDPAEPANRAVFDVNRGLDAAVLKPVATIYRDNMPVFIQHRITAVLDNLRAPVTFVNDVLQGELERAVNTVIRFVLNSSLGILGLNDIATDMGIDGHDEDFGQTLAVWGVSSGPYVMLPLFGPSNPRDAIGMAVDFLFDPFSAWASRTGRDFAVYARSSTRAVDLRATHMDNLDNLEKSSLDFYASIRSLYRQRRAGEINNGDPSANLPAPGFGPGVSRAPSGDTTLETKEAPRTQ